MIRVMANDGTQFTTKWEAWNVAGDYMGIGAVMAGVNPVATCLKIARRPT